jgi:uncharacterized membrane protein
MMRTIAAFGATAAMFIALDFCWLSTMSPTVYQDEIGPLLLAHPRMGAAVLFYLIYLVGVVVFVVNRALEQRSLRTAAVLGALFGVVAYATYDLTNLATLDGFTTRLAVIDMIWGAVVTASAASVGYLAASRISAAAAPKRSTPSRPAGADAIDGLGAAG